LTSARGVLGIKANHDWILVSIAFSDSMRQSF